MNLSTSLYTIAGIGPSLGKRLAYLNLNTVEDMIYHFPFRYDDFSNITNALESQVGEKVTLQGEIWSIRNIYTRTRKVLTQAVFNDGTSPIELTWFNQSWLTNQIKTGDRLQVSGKVSKYKNKISIMAPVWEKMNSEFRIQNSELLHTGRLVPVYPETAGLTSKWIRAKVDQVLPKVIDEIEDPLPSDIRAQMLELREAIKLIHFPDSYKDVENARERLGFDELFLIQLATLKTRLEWKDKPAKICPPGFRSPYRHNRVGWRYESDQGRIMNSVL
ncbi:MAG: ATP-dependent DNA helicase RecG [Candidatus Daviesbacteria bacterium GW2011_GWB1_36_5]|uniref:ATP-dependent DNA helicase RecG n=1 Tax=Candidatus Daviesbacteria bacterium GW2011_GWB1_36_5 TaxID=1618426 RepID=A0A0G0I342_9BACT|nr:MAG: ATP-dependent DNA helicase RecG [Candidatus Daviesbacteria bacterium GW2011_GWB1_36_5]